MVLDFLKERSDDAYYTEEHIIFLASKIRSMLIERKYKASRNTPFSTMSDENKQRICLNLVPAIELYDSCTGDWLKTAQKVPDLMPGTDADAYAISDMIHSHITFIPKERMPFVGYNKWLHNVIYCSRSDDGYIYARSNNSQFMYIEKIVLNGVFSSPDKAAKLECNQDGETMQCDILDHRFPLEDSLIPQCIEMIVNTLTNSKYAPEDKVNNAKDDFGAVQLQAHSQQQKQ